MVFEIFRRRQRTMIVILAVLAMFAFVFAGAFEAIMSRQRIGMGSGAVASAWGKTISSEELFQIQRDRAIANQFVNRALVATGQQPLRFPYFDQSEGAVLESIVLLEKAKRMGMSVTDANVNEFIQAITQNRLSRNDFYNILHGSGVAGEGGPLSTTESDLFRILGRELLVNQVTNVLSPPVIRDTPLETWEQIEPTLTNVQLELARIPVENFADKTEEPTEDDLRGLYDQYKGVRGDLDAGIPGLLRPHRVDVEYLIASIDSFEGNVSVTEEEAKSYYEENKDEFRLDATPPSDPSSAPPLPDFGPATKDIPLPPADDSEKPEKDEKETKPEKAAESPEKDEKPAEKPETPAEPKDEKTESEPKAQEPSEPSKDAKAEESEPAKEEPKADQPSKAEDEAKAEPETKEDSSASAAPAFGRLLQTLSLTTLAYQEADAKDADGPDAADAKEEKAEEPAKEEKPDAEAPKAEKTDAKPAKDEAAKPSEDAKAKPAEDAKAEPAEDAKAKPATEKDEAPAEPEPTYEPFDEVKDQIIERLRREKAREQAIETLEEIRSTTMDRYRDRFIVERTRFRRSATSGTDGTVDMRNFTPPSRPDLARLAEQTKLSHGTTGLADYETLGEQAGLRDSIRVTDDDLGTASAFQDVVFTQGMFRGRVFESDDGKLILSWKIEDRPERQPTFEESRETLVKIWRLEQARPLAEEKAKEIAENAKEADGDLAAAVKDTEFVVATTGLFPRRTQAFDPSMMFGAPQMQPTTIPEAPNAGVQFLDEVFKHDVGEIITLPDEGRQNYYVVKIKDRVEPNFSRFTQRYNVEMTVFRNPAMQRGFSQQQMELFERHRAQRMEIMSAILEEANFEQFLPDEPTAMEAGEEPAPGL